MLERAVVRTRLRHDPHRRDVGGCGDRVETLGEMHQALRERLHAWWGLDVLFEAEDARVAVACGVGQEGAGVPVGGACLAVGDGPAA